MNLDNDIRNAREFEEAWADYMKLEKKLNRAKAKLAESPTSEKLQKAYDTAYERRYPTRLKVIKLYSKLANFEDWRSYMEIERKTNEIEQAVRRYAK